MDFNASIVDQRVRGLAETHRDRLSGSDEQRRALAFLLLCIKTVLDLDDQEGLACLTDGGNDADVDAIHAGDIRDGEFPVTLFQAKYKQDLAGRAAFPSNAVKKILGTVAALFDPDKPLTLREELALKVEELRSLVRDGNIPLVRVILCNNGQPWGADAGEAIRNAGLGYQVSWEHVNHDRLVQLLQRRRTVSDDLRLSGKAFVEEFNFRRVLIGKVPVPEIKALFDRHGDLLLERNIRRYLGFYENRVNRGIRETLADEKRRDNFYFYNNGITVVCSKFRHNALQAENWRVHVEDLQIINGGQTCRTIQRALAELPDDMFDQTFVLLRLYELGDADDALVGDITYATNSQNPIDLSELKANDDFQQRLELGLRDLGYEYKRKRDASPAGPATITPLSAAEAVFAVWRRKPHLMRFHHDKLFGDFYEEIFSASLNPAQVILAALIHRAARNDGGGSPDSALLATTIFYAHDFLAMLIGAGFLRRAGTTLDRIDHRSFAELRDELEATKARLYHDAQVQLAEALQRLGVISASGIPASLQRLAATFRRGDLLEELTSAGYL